MCEEDTYTVPEHYLLLGRDLTPLRDKIRTGLRNRVSCPSSRMKCLSQVSTLDFKAFEPVKMAASLNDVTKKVLSHQSVSQGAISAVIDELFCSINEWLAAFHVICNRQFPDGYEEGHRLAVALPERLLQQLVEFLDKVILVIEDPVSAVKQYGSTQIHLHIKFNIDAETRHFIDWTQNIKCDYSYNDHGCYSQGHEPAKNKSRGLLWGILGGIGLYSLSSGNHN